MKVSGTQLLEFKNHDLLVLSFHKELIGSKYFAEGRFSPDPMPRKIKLSKLSDTTFPEVNLRILDLPGTTISKFISDLSSADQIDLAAHPGDYDIIFKAVKETDSKGSYINYKIQARNKTTRAMSSTIAKTNPCPPCHYSAGQ